MININISGPDKSGKGHAIALISKKLRELGLKVTVQSEQTHNASKIAKDETDLIERLKDVEITITELQTAF